MSQRTPFVLVISLYHASTDDVNDIIGYFAGSALIGKTLTVLEEMPSVSKKPVGWDEQQD